MTTITSLSSLLKRPEDATLDFKRDDYELGTAKGKAAFVKDLLAMANTRRAGEAQIVIGVAWSAADGHSVVGLASARDETHYRNAVPYSLTPRSPQFVVDTQMHGGKLITIIRIPHDSHGPFMLQHDMGEHGEVRAGVVYARRGTQNAGLAGPELLETVFWFSELRGHQKPPYHSDTDALEWVRLNWFVREFGPHTKYVLICDRPAELEPVRLTSLSRIPWSAVVDFDARTDVDGLLAALAPHLSHRSIARLIRGDAAELRTPIELPWFFANGMEGRGEAPATTGFGGWLRAKYRFELRAAIGRLAQAWSPTPVVVLLALSGSEYAEHAHAIASDVLEVTPQEWSTVVVSRTPQIRARTQTLDEVASIELTLPELADGVLATGIGAGASEARGATVTVPSRISGGVPLSLTIEDLTPLSEVLELVHLGLPEPAESVADDRSFLRGQEITWSGLDQHVDSDRDQTAELRRRIQQSLEARATTRINLFHVPGAGGTTLGKRILWELRHQYPSAVLLSSAPRTAAERVSRLSTMTQAAVLLLVDSGKHSERETEEFYNLLRGQQTPVTMLQIVRKFDPPTAPQALWLKDVLSDQESARFERNYAAAAGRERIAAIQAVRRRARCTAFDFGLAAYEDDYRGVGPYVERRLNNLDATLRQIVLTLALCYKFGQQAVPANAFAAVLGLPRTREVSFETVVSRVAGLSDLVVPSEDNEWRISHQVVADAIVARLLGSEGAVDGWQLRLSGAARELIELFQPAAGAESERLVEILRRVLIYRGNAELLGTERAAAREYSPLLETIPSTEGRLDVLRTLTEHFPGQAHFHAHLGRMLGQEGRHKEAADCVDRAIHLQSDDHVLYHMRGMISRYQVAQAMKEQQPLDALLPEYRSAISYFERARTINPNEEHSYISEVQLILKLLDYAAMLHKTKIVSFLRGPHAPEELREALERAHALLERIRAVRGWERPSHYEENAEAELSAKVYGDFSAALQTWDQLLRRNDVVRKAPVRRQIVFTLLQREHGSWPSLAQKDLKRAVDLLEDNLQEAPQDETSIRLWLRAVRHLAKPPSLDRVIERVAYWKGAAPSLEGAFYLYVLHALNAIDGSREALRSAERAMEECRSYARTRRDRSLSIEFLGKGVGIQRLAHTAELGTPVREIHFESQDRLARVPGVITRLDGPQKGRIEVDGGLSAFFVPKVGGFDVVRQTNVRVVCSVGFTYDGLHAWGVARAQ